MATLADVTRNRNILNIWSVVRRFTRGRWTEATIPTMPEIIAMLSLTELTEVTIQPGAQSPHLLQTLDREVKHAVLVYPKGPTDAVLLQNPAVNPRIAYNEETGALTFAFDELPGTLTLIINDMLANDEATTQATLLNSPLQIQGYNPETAYTQGDIALYDDGVRKTLIVSNAPTQGEFDPTKWSILVTKDEYQPALALITQNLQSEIARATAQENQITQNLSTETTRATAAEQGLRQDIASEVTRATAQEGQIAHDLSSEVSRATAAEQSLSQSLQQEITQRQAKDIASVQYNASTNSLQHTRTDATTVNVALPVADSNKNGLMSRQTYDQVQDIASIVSELVGKGTRRLTSAAINPEPEPTPDATWQASMNALWATASSGATPVDGDTLISTNSATLWRLATYVASSNAWVYRGADTLSIASPTQLGIVLSTQAVDNTMENGGSVFVEQGTGAMVVNGWDNMTGRITSMEAFMNRQAGFATAAQGSLADTLNQTAVKITGDQSIDGVKNFIGTLQIDGASIESLFLAKADKTNATQTITAYEFISNALTLKEVSFGSIALDINTFYNIDVGAPAVEVKAPGILYLMHDLSGQNAVDIRGDKIDLSNVLNLKGGLKFNGTDISSLFVDIANAQTITGAKTFVNYLTVAGGQTLASESMQFVAIDGQGGHINVAQGDLFIELFGAGAALRIVPPTNFSSAVTFANNTWNNIGDDILLGDRNVAGALCLEGITGNTTIRMYQQGDTADYADISYHSKAVHVSRAIQQENVRQYAGSFFRFGDTSWVRVGSFRTDGNSNRILGGRIYTHLYYGPNDAHQQICDFNVVVNNDQVLSGFITSTAHMSSILYTVRLRFIKTGDWAWDMHMYVPNWSSNLVKLDYDQSILFTFDANKENTSSPDAATAALTISSTVNNMEYGSGNDSQYVKYPSGLMIQWGTLADGNSNRLVTYAQPFTSIDSYSLVASANKDGNAGAWAQAAKRSNQTAWIRMRTANNYYTESVCWVAIGRWK